MFIFSVPKQSKRAVEKDFRTVNYSRFCRTVVLAVVAGLWGPAAAAAWAQKPAAPAGAAPGYVVPGDPAAARVVYADQAGCKLDGVTNDTAAFQAILDRASDGQPLTVVIPKGTLAIDRARVWGNTTLAGYGARVLARPGSGGPLLENRHPAGPGDGPILDADIALYGLSMDGNRRGGASGSSDPRKNKNGRFVVCVQLSGVRRPVARDNRVYDSCTYGFLVSNIEDGRFEKNDFDVSEATYQNNAGYNTNTDGIHAVGPILRCRFTQTSGRTGDDLVALCANDGHQYVTDPAKAPYGPHVKTGPVLDNVVDGVIGRGALFGVRLLSHDQPLDRNVVRNVSGSFNGQAVLADDFNNKYLGDKSANGNFGTNTIENVDVTFPAEPVANTVAGADFKVVIELGGRHRAVLLQNLVRNNTLGDRPLIRWDADTDIGLLDIDGVTVSAGANALPTTHLLGRGRVNKLAVRRVTWTKTGGGAPGDVFFRQEGGSVADLSVDAYQGPNGSSDAGLLALSGGARVSRLVRNGVRAALPPPLVPAAAAPSVAGGTVYALSTFAGPAGTRLGAYTPEAGPAWTVHNGAYALDGAGRVTNTGAFPVGGWLATQDAARADGRATLVTSGPFVGVQWLLRWKDGNNYLAANLQTNGLQVYEIVNGKISAPGYVVTMNLVGANALPNAGRHVWKITLRNDAVTVQVDDKPVATGAHANPALRTATRFGLAYYQSTGTGAIEEFRVESP